MSTSFQLSGLASGFDWKSFVDQLMAVSRTPADRLTAEKAVNSQKVTGLSEFGTRLTALEASVVALGSSGAFGQRTAVSGTSGSSWISSAAVGTAVGAYKIAVSKLASAARLDGAVNIGSALSTTSDVSGLTLANLATGRAITAGTFSVNGAKVTVGLDDSLADVLAAVSTATGSAVTAAYNPTTDKIELASSGEIVLGASNDTSNFLQVLKLANNGTGSIASSTALGSVKTGAALASANLASAITAVDGAGNGTFSLNGVSIAYNVNTDTLSGILARINQSDAGVTASYDATHDRLALVNSTTGDVGLGMSESAGGLLAALGISSGGTLTRGTDAKFTLNDGPELTSQSNTLDATAHGITGLAVTLNSEGTQTIQVGSDSSGARAKIEDFISKFNDVQAFLESSTKISVDAKGKVTAALFAGNREIQAFGSSLRATAFAAVSGLTGSISRLDSLGIDFKAGTNQLEIRDSAKLDSALRGDLGEVQAFFGTATTGFVDKIKALTSGGVAQNAVQTTNLTKYNASIDAQIAEIERRLTQQRAVLEAAFINMELAQSNLQSQQTALTNAFPTTTK